MLQKQTILVVDDDEIRRASIVEKLLQAGYGVIDADNGFQGLEKARKENPGLILVDTQMPIMNGFKMARMLKFDTRYASIPIMMMTEEGEDQSKELGLESGASEIITKPIDFDYLLKRIEASLSKVK